MKIRSITSFYNPALSEPRSVLSHLSKFTQEALSAYANEAFEVQTTRLATVPFSQYTNVSDRRGAINTLKSLEAAARDAGYSYLSIGPALPENPASYYLIPEIFAETEIVFASGVMADSEKGLYLKAIQDCGQIIANTAVIELNGFANLRFTALANVPPFGPFFPAAYSRDNHTAFSLAVESADLAVDAFNRASTLDEARRFLLNMLNSKAQQLTEVAERLSKQFDIEFKGLDISLAPFPIDSCSLGGALEALCGENQLGLNSSVAAAAFIAEILDRGNWKKAGFNGLMLPVLEDSILAKRTISSTYGVKDLLLYSAVCGAGLDTVPLPGDATSEQLSALLLDVAALAIRLNKPLTARLMPVPGKKAGDLTSFNFAFFENGRILELPAKRVSKLFSSDETVEIKSRFNSGRE